MLSPSRTSLSSKLVVSGEAEVTFPEDFSKESVGGWSRIRTSDSSLKNSWAAYGPGNSNHLEIILTDLEVKDP